ncbi:MAG: alanine/glycine:cation symporter family protein [Deltaproteobacteria bacterium]
MNGFDTKVNQLLTPLADGLSALVFYSVPIAGARVPLIVAWLVAAGIFFTVYLRLINFRGMAEACRIVAGRRRGSGEEGQISAWEALSTAVSGTVGIGNIGGVAVAISLGGPGATLWMLVAGLLGMATKCAECVLGVRYRQVDEAGEVSGGPMYYLRAGLAEYGWPRSGRVLGAFYAGAMVLGCLGIGNMFQSNQAFEQIVVASGGQASPLADHPVAVGLVLAAAVGLVIVGGIRSIATVTTRLVPFMAIFYCLGCLVVIGLNAAALPAALVSIWEGAFSPRGMSGGVLGVMVLGFQRAAFSNEAGLGSAAIAHSAVRTHHPATEGLVALLEPFIDTVVICTMTALVILTTVYQPMLAAGQIQQVQGVALTSAAFASTLPWSPPVVAFAALLFAYSTMIAWAYYGLKGWSYLVGNSRTADLAFKLVYCAFVVLGCTLDLGAVLALSDALIFVVAFPNVLGLYLLAPQIRETINDYLG